MTFTTISLADSMRLNKTHDVRYKRFYALTFGTYRGYSFTGTLIVSFDSYYIDNRGKYYVQTYETQQ